MKLKSAFTLAEILITLTIIGVLAVVLLPRTLNNANVMGARNKFKTTYAQIQKGFKVAKEVDRISFLEITNMSPPNSNPTPANNVDNFVQRYFGARVVTNHVLAGTNGKTYQLPNGTQLIIPASTATIITNTSGNGCVETSTLSEKCIAYIDVNGSKAPNEVLGTVVNSGSDNTPDDTTGACIDGTYAINTEISDNNCVVPHDVYFDIFPIVLSNNNLEPYSNAVAYILGLSTEARNTEVIQPQEQGDGEELTLEEIQQRIDVLQEKDQNGTITEEEKLELEHLLELLKQMGGGNP